MPSRRGHRLSIESAGSAINSPSVLSPAKPDIVCEPLLEGSSSKHALVYDKSVTSRERRRWVWITFWLCGVSIITWFGFSVVRGETHRTPVDRGQSKQQTYSFPQNSTVSGKIGPVIVPSGKGHSRWTVAISPDHDFPLRPKQYADICSQSKKVAHHVMELNSPANGTNRQQGHYGYSHVDPHFIEASEVEEYIGVRGDVGRTDTLDSERQQHVKTVCQKSLTYVLETSNAGLGDTLMGLWMSYGLAKKENRTFFINDSNW